MAYTGDDHGPDHLPQGFNGGSDLAMILQQCLGDDLALPDSWTAEGGSNLDPRRRIRKTRTTKSRVRNVNYISPSTTITFHQMAR